VPIKWETFSVSAKGRLNPYPTLPAADRHRTMFHPDTIPLRLEALAIASRLRRYGEHDIADLVERWAESADLGAPARVVRLTRSASSTADIALPVNRRAGSSLAVARQGERRAACALRRNFAAITSMLGMLTVVWSLSATYRCH